MKMKKQTALKILLYAFGTLLVLNSVVLLFTSNIHMGVFAELIFGER